LISFRAFASRDLPPIDDYEREAQEALHLQSAGSAYQSIRAMAERALKKPEERARVWSALESFWQDYPAFDPDDLASHFRPLAGAWAAPSPVAPSPPGTAESSIESASAFDLALLDEPDTVNAATADDLFSPDKLAAIAPNLASAGNTILLKTAEATGIVDWKA
jgi:hypothetical protein